MLPARSLFENERYCYVCNFDPSAILAIIDRVPDPLARLVRIYG